MEPANDSDADLSDFMQESSLTQASAGYRCEKYFAPIFALRELFRQKYFKMKKLSTSGTVVPYLLRAIHAIMQSTK